MNYNRMTMSLITLVLSGIGGTVSAIATLTSLANDRPPTYVINYGLPEYAIFPAAATASLNIISSMMRIKGRVRCVLALTY